MNTAAESATTLPQPRARVLTMPEYHPPLAGRDALRLDFNENTLAPSPRVIAKLRELTAEGLTVYPEREPTERIVAAQLGLEPNQIILTNGVDEAIHLVACAFLDEGDEALICTPTFFMYDVSVSLMTNHLVRVQTDDTLAFPFERFLQAITPKTKLIIVASPNNPTGSVVSREHLLAIAHAAPHAVLMVDEAYFHFFGDTVLPDIAEIPNLIVARTFSKAYGLASLRIGMLAADPRLIGFLRKVSSPYNVNGVALAVLPEAVADTDYLDWYTLQVHTGRERITSALKTAQRPHLALRRQLRPHGHRPAPQGTLRPHARQGRTPPRPLLRPRLRRLRPHYRGPRRTRHCRHRSPHRHPAGDELAPHRRPPPPHHRSRTPRI